MDFIDSEKKLIQTQITIIQALRQEEMLSKINSTVEHLQACLPEHVPATMKTEETLSIDKKLELPLKVRGSLLGVGRHKRRYYTADELRRSVKLHNNKPIPIRLEHKKPDVTYIIGVVDKLYWDESRREVMYEGHINDETHARNVLDTIEKSVSGGMAALEDFDPQLGIIAKDVEFTELSIVHEGSYRGNSIEAVL